MEILYNYNVLNDLLKFICENKGQNHIMVLKANKKRKREFVEIRQITMAIYRNNRNDLSLDSIGEFFDKDHATVLHACKTYNNLKETERKYREFGNMVEKWFIEKFSDINGSIFLPEIFEDPIPKDKTTLKLILFGCE